VWRLPASDGLAPGFFYAFLAPVIRSVFSLSWGEDEAALAAFPPHERMDGERLPYAKLVQRDLLQPAESVVKTSRHTS
jgi:hypothetical protein